MARRFYPGPDEGMLETSWAVETGSRAECGACERVADEPPCWVSSDWTERYEGQIGYGLNITIIRHSLIVLLISLDSRRAQPSQIIYKYSTQMNKTDQWYQLPSTTDVARNATFAKQGGNRVVS
jgi:hypothetical protein